MSPELKKVKPVGEPIAVVQVGMESHHLETAVVADTNDPQLLRRAGAVALPHDVLQFSLAA